AKGDPRTLFEQAPNAYTAKLLARANVLSSEEAGLLGIFSEKSIGIHLYELELNRNPEHHRPHKAVPNRLQGPVEAVYFKGLHTELSVHISGVRLRICVSRDQVWELGESVGVRILSYWQLSK